LVRVERACAGLTRRGLLGAEQVKARPARTGLVQAQRAGLNRRGLAGNGLGRLRRSETGGRAETLAARPEAGQALTRAPSLRGSVVRSLVGVVRAGPAGAAEGFDPGARGSGSVRARAAGPGKVCVGAESAQRVGSGGAGAEGFAP
jgi:hypothetical protein